MVVYIKLVIEHIRLVMVQIIKHIRLIMVLIIKHIRLIMGLIIKHIKLGQFIKQLRLVIIQLIVIIQLRLVIRQLIKLIRLIELINEQLIFQLDNIQLFLNIYRLVHILK
jgi:hypothetical protein